MPFLMFSQNACMHSSTSALDQCVCMCIDQCVFDHAHFWEIHTSSSEHIFTMVIIILPVRSVWRMSSLLRAFDVIEHMNNGYFLFTRNSFNNIFIPPKCRLFGSNIIIIISVWSLAEFATAVPHPSIFPQGHWRVSNATERICRLWYYLVFHALVDCPSTNNIMIYDT